MMKQWKVQLSQTLLSSYYDFKQHFLHYVFSLCRFCINAHHIRLQKNSSHLFLSRRSLQVNRVTPGNNPSAYETRGHNPVHQQFQTQLPLGEINPCLKSFHRFTTEIWINFFVSYTLKIIFNQINYYWKNKILLYFCKSAQKKCPYDPVQKSAKDTGFLRCLSPSEKRIQRQTEEKPGTSLLQ